MKLGWVTRSYSRLGGSVAERGDLPYEERFSSVMGSFILPAIHAPEPLMIMSPTLSFLFIFNQLDTSYNIAQLKCFSFIVFILGTLL